MKIVFFGSGLFAVESLKALVSAKQNVVLVVTRPDVKQGRHLLIKGTPVKEYALSQGLEIYQPRDINNEESQRILEEMGADVFIVVSFGRILKKNILDLPKMMAINIHASLLPQYRGASPVNQALINGDLKTGVTFIRMNERMDEGDMIWQKEIVIGQADNAPILEQKLSSLAADSLMSVLSALKEGRVDFKKQDEKFVKYAPIIKKEDGLICWEKSAKDIVNHFRGYFGWPGSFTYHKGSILKILSLDYGRQEDVDASPGEVINITSDFIEVACLCGSVLIREVVPQAHKKMSVKSFLAGHKLEVGEVFGR
ncbi:MAG: methionyl-tRNA formyltransferase [Candidatus Omnitrophota bacterium]